ncbi:MAG: class I SAM-dependent methyltransferase [Deltaproteobacteria bacterium]|nr:class I SAM-dependent methyltransferase [Candidatus Zymogenaceae bacterium]
MKECLKKILPECVLNVLRVIRRKIKYIYTIDAIVDDLNSLRSHVLDIEVELTQLKSVIQYESDMPLPPPKHLQVRVVGGYAPTFIQSGFRVCNHINDALKTVEKELTDFNTILDFGCGCGRVIRCLKIVHPSSDLYGTDIDSEAIEWLSDNYSKYGSFSVSPHMPPTEYQDNFFDFIYGISVFTHLPEDMQCAWLNELRRITKRKGYLILTTHGEKHYGKCGMETTEIMANKGFLYRQFDNYGERIQLPSFYQNTYHSHDYIRREWGKLFDVIDIKATGMENHQDAVLLQNK